MELILKSEKSLNRLDNLRAFLLSGKWMAFLSFISAIAITITHIFPGQDIEIKFTVVFAYIAAFCFAVCKDLFAVLYPLLCTYMVAIQCFDSFDKFMSIKWWLVPIFIPILFHLVCYRKRLTTKGTQFVPMLLVSIAIILGGIGFISKEEYFSGTSIYHMLGLGFGMVFIYSYFFAHIEKNEKYDITEMMTKIMVLTGALASFMVVSFYIVNIEMVIESIATRSVIYMQWRNNCSTILMLSIPFAFMLAHKKPFASVLGFVFYFAILLTGSRGGMVFGSIEIVMCVIMFILYDKRRRVAYVIIGLCVIFGCLVFAPQLTELLGSTIDRLFSAINGFLIGDKTEIRVRHYAQGIQDFLGQPIFGTGLGYMGNRDIHASRKFALCWYHCEPIQIIASFGLVGAVTFTYQFIRRMMLLWRKSSLFNVTVFLSYISLELMSLVNPGILCPVPYLLLIVIFMVVVEKNDEYRENGRLKISKEEKIEVKQR